MNDKAYKWALKSNTIVKFWRKKKVCDEVCRWRIRIRIRIRRRIRIRK